VNIDSECRHCRAVVIGSRLLVELEPFDRVEELLDHGNSGLTLVWVVALQLWLCAQSKIGQECNAHLGVLPDIYATAC